MAVITGPDLKELIDYGAVQEMIDPKVQVQMCGIDLTLRKVERLVSMGVVDYDNTERRVSDTKEIPFDGSDWAVLEEGAYLVTFNEVVSIPRNLAATASPRSSLLRCGASIETAVWDPGYKGRSQSLLVIYNPSGLRLKKNARLMQLVFQHLSGAAEKVYSGTYQGENL